MKSDLTRACYTQSVNRNVPIQEVWEIDGRGKRQSNGHFDFDRMLGGMESGLPGRDRRTGIFAWELPVHPKPGHILLNQSRAGVIA